MEWILHIISVMLYAFVAYQDFRSRAFFVILIPLLIASNVFLGLNQVNGAEFFEIVKWNVIFVGVLFGAVYLVMAFRTGSFALPQSRIGLGDVLIVLTLIPLFSSTLFRMVFLSSALSGLLFGFLYKRTRESEIKIPLAGLIAVISAVLIVFDSLNILDLYVDPVVYG